MKTKLFLILFALLLIVNPGWSIGKIDDVEADVATNATNIGINQDSLQAASWSRMRQITFAGVVATDGADTAYFATVTGLTATIVRIEGLVGVGGADLQNTQLVCIGAGGTETSMSADTDWDAAVVGSVIRWDMSNLAAVTVITAPGVPIISGDLYGAVFEVPVGARLGLEMGESPSVNCSVNITIWYIGGTIAAP